METLITNGKIELIYSRNSVSFHPTAYVYKERTTLEITLSDSICEIFKTDHSDSMRDAAVSDLDLRCLHL